MVTCGYGAPPPHAPLEVSARTDHDGAVVTVRDHGPGLDPDALTHVFDRFWQADRARVGHGTGLGLSIVAAIAHEHGGTATAANAAGGGASFTLRLPLAGDASSPGGTEVSVAPSTISHPRGGVG